VCAASAASSAMASASDPSVLKAMLRESLLSLGQTAERLGTEAAAHAQATAQAHATAEASPPGDAPAPLSAGSEAFAGAPGDGARSLLLLRKYATNILNAPFEPKYRTIRLFNSAFRHRLGKHAAARAVLRLVGFVAPEPSQDPQERAWVLPPSADTSRLGMLVSEIDELPGQGPAHGATPTAGAAGPASSRPSGGAASGAAGGSGGAAAGGSSSGAAGRSGRGAAGSSLPPVEEDVVMAPVAAPVRVAAGGGSRDRAHATLTEAQVRILRGRAPWHTGGGGGGWRVAPAISKQRTLPTRVGAPSPFVSSRSLALAARRLRL
jgi:uncharacterized membrane protein YgcG